MPNNTFPYELLGPGFTLYFATAGTTRPDIEDPVPGTWTRIGTNGNKSYAEEGVRVNIPQSVNAFRGYGSAAPLKFFRAEEDVIVQVSMADLTVEAIRQALNQNTVTEAGVSRRVALSRGLSVATVALLARGPSPYFNNGASQFWVPYMANVASPEIPLRRDNASIYTLEWRALVDPAPATEGEELGVFEGEDETT